MLISLENIGKKKQRFTAATVRFMTSVAMIALQDRKLRGSAVKSLARPTSHVVGRNR